MERPNFMIGGIGGAGVLVHMISAMAEKMNLNPGPSRHHDTRATGGHRGLHLCAQNARDCRKRTRVKLARKRRNRK